MEPDLEMVLRRIVAFMDRWEPVLERFVNQGPMSWALRRKHG